jgi:hypothetical protein
VIHELVRVGVEGVDHAHWLVQCDDVVVLRIAGVESPIVGERHKLGVGVHDFTASVRVLRVDNRGRVPSCVHILPQAVVTVGLPLDHVGVFHLSAVADREVRVWCHNYIVLDHLQVSVVLAVESCSIVKAYDLSRCRVEQT